MAFLGAVTLAGASARSPLASNESLSPAQRLALLDQDPPEDDGAWRHAMSSWSMHRRVLWARQRH